MIDSPKLNPEILKQCRRQIGLDNIEDAKKVTGIDSLADIEQANKPPTLLQQEKIANAYSVPSWVFFQRSLPPEYDFSKEEYHPEFRVLKDRRIKVDYKINKVVHSFSNFRIDLLSVYEDDGANIAEFNPPENDDLQVLAKETREWLGYDNTEFRKYHEKNRAIDYWKELIEDKGVLIFTTSPYPHWSKVDKEVMRGLAIYHKVFPMIIINGSDYFKAQLFTLMHELAHIIKYRTFLNHDYLSSEKFCNEFASEILMPDEQVRPTIKKLKAKRLNLKEITSEVAREYGVSQLAVATKMLVTQKIDQDQYLNFEKSLKELYIERLNKNKKRAKVIARKPLSVIPNENPLKNTRKNPRKRHQEIIDLHSKIYTRAILQLYNDEEITLSKLCNALGIKQINHLKEIQEEV